MVSLAGDCVCVCARKLRGGMFVCLFVCVGCISEGEKDDEYVCVCLFCMRVFMHM